MFANLMVALASPVARSVLVALGFAVVTYEGASMALDMLIDQAIANWTGLPADVTQYLAMAGVHDGLALVSGSLSARVALWSAKALELV